MFSVTLFNLQGTRRFAAVIALAERLDYLTTSRFACQELFSSFFKVFSTQVFFATLIRFVFRLTVERLLILSEPFLFVNTFFRFFQSFFDLPDLPLFSGVPTTKYRTAPHLLSKQAAQI